MTKSISSSQNDPVKEVLGEVTSIFESFCKENGLVILYGPADKHGIWEWSAIRTTEINRYVSLDLSHRRYSEIWMEADDGTKFYKERHSYMELDIGSEQAQARLSVQLSDAWNKVLTVEKDELKQKYMISEIQR